MEKTLWDYGKNTIFRKKLGFGKVFLTIVKKISKIIKSFN